MESVLRVAFVYVFILVVLRVLGKRELSQMSPSELVMLLLIPELVAQGVVREDFSMTNAIILVTTLLSLVFLTSVLAYRFKRFGEMLEGKPAVLVAQGKLANEAMDTERVAADEILAEIRKAGVERLEDVKWAILEADGRIAVIGHRAEEMQPRRESEIT